MLPEIDFLLKTLLIDSNSVALMETSYLKNSVRRKLVDILGTVNFL